ncbi:MAG TPA: hypothetical protein VNI55_05425 [Gaiellaceae bacterium]|nr:hypothetical protein [Gaiellaceae bacterium]
MRSSRIAELPEHRHRSELAWLGVFLLPEGPKTSNYIFFAILPSPLLILAFRVLATGGWPAARHADRGST